MISLSSFWYSGFRLGFGIRLYCSNSCNGRVFERAVVGKAPAGDYSQLLASVAANSNNTSSVGVVSLDDMSGVGMGAGWNIDTTIDVNSSPPNSLSQLPTELRIVLDIGESVIENYDSRVVSHGTSGGFGLDLLQICRAFFGGLVLNEAFLVIEPFHWFWFLVSLIFQSYLISGQRASRSFQ
jgi:hypothetical protein